MDTQPLPKLKNAVATDAAKKSYVVVTGFNFDCTQENPEGQRVEVGFLKVELPQSVLLSLLAQGVIREGK